MSSEIGFRKLKKFFSEMLRIRIIEEELAHLYAEQEMRCPVHFCIGQEAMSVAVCQSLGPDDTVMSTHRSHGHYLAKGGNLKAMVAEFYGKQTGCASGKGGSMHLMDLSANFLGATSIVSGTIPVATGVAFANLLKGRKSVSVVFFGDAATEAGPFYESLNFAALHNLPVLYVCENNLYSTLSHISCRQPESRKIYQVARSLGVPSLRVNGNDVASVYRAAREAVKAIREGKGPRFIEGSTYRYLEHCGPLCDHEEGHRPSEEVMEWTKRDPIKKLERKLLKHSVIGRDYSEKLTRRFKKEIHEAVLFAKSSPWPDASELTSDVYVVASHEK